MWKLSLMSQAGGKGSALNVRRGILFALVFALVGFLAPIALYVSYSAVGWWWSKAGAWDREYDVRLMPLYLAQPAIGTSLVFAAAGWATFAPRGAHRFARTLAIVCAVSIPLWFVLGTVYEESGLAPRRYYTAPETWEPLRDAIFFTPPLATAFALSAARAGRQKWGLLDEI